MESFHRRPFLEFTRAEHGQRETEPFLLKAREAAQHLAFSERYLYQLTASGELPCVRIGKLVRYSVETLRKWIQDLESAEHPPLPRKGQPKRPAVQPRQVPVPRAASKHRYPAEKKPVSAREPRAVQGSAKTVSDRSHSDVESAERCSRLSQFLKGKGITRSTAAPPKTYVTYGIRATRLRTLAHKLVDQWIRHAACR